MILVDTSVWIDHLHKAEPTLVELLLESLVELRASPFRRAGGDPAETAPDVRQSA